MKEENIISAEGALPVSRLRVTPAGDLDKRELEVMPHAYLDGCNPESVFFARDVFYDFIP